MLCIPHLGSRAAPAAAAMARTPRATRAIVAPLFNSNDVPSRQLERQCHLRYLNE